MRPRAWASFSTAGDDSLREQQDGAQRNAESDDRALLAGHRSRAPGRGSGSSRGRGTRRPTAASCAHLEQQLRSARFQPPVTSVPEPRVKQEADGGTHGYRGPAQRRTVQQGTCQHHAGGRKAGQQRDPEHDIRGPGGARIVHWVVGTTVRVRAGRERGDRHPCQQPDPAAEQGRGQREHPRPGPGWPGQRGQRHCGDRHDGPEQEQDRPLPAVHVIPLGAGDHQGQPQGGSVLAVQVDRRGDRRQRHGWASPGQQYLRAEGQRQQARAERPGQADSYRLHPEAGPPPGTQLLDGHSADGTGQRAGTPDPDPPGSSYGRARSPGELSFQLHASSSSSMAAARPASTPTAVSQSDRPAASTAYSPHPDGSARTSVAKAGVTPVLSSPEVRTATAGIHPDWLRMSSPAISTPTTAEPILLLAT